MPATRSRRWIGSGRLGVVTLTALTVSGMLVGCGSTAAPQPKVAKADASCRDQWQDLKSEYADRDSSTAPSDLAERWTALLATADYYVDSAKESDCGGPLEVARDSAERIESLSDKLRRFDVPWTVDDLSPAVTTYLVAPLPKPHRVKGTLVDPPTKRQVQDALKTLAASGPAAVADMRSGWEEMVAVDLTDAAKTVQAFKDMRFLAGDSAPYQESLQALDVVERAVGFVADDGPDTGTTQ